jgi:2',3'-cyclic-nucleotide 2'-phosphodiesterase (5'-nucleotidase family)
MEANSRSGGAAGMVERWRSEEGYVEDGPYLILSGGDMWIGPAISTWYDGESMVEVMNAMNYDAAAMGNHEFDLGIQVLRDRLAQAEFPFLSANIRSKGIDETTSHLAIPSIVHEVSGVRVGLIGLTTTATPRVTMPRVIAGLEFVPYQDVLPDAVSRVKAEGADVLVVLAHVCAEELRELAPLAASLGVTVMGGGHCHQPYTEIVNGVAVIVGGGYLTHYVRVDLAVDVATGAVLSVTSQLRPNPPGAADPEVGAVIDHWRVKADEALNTIIGYLNRPIQRHSDAMFNLVTDAWLEAYPAADVAITNRGGFRQDLPAGPVTLASVVAVLPFDNVLYDIEITGAQLVESLNCSTCGAVVGGMTALGRYVLDDGRPVDPTTHYRVLVNDFNYEGGNGFRFAQYDPAAYNTAVDWRQPVIDWILARRTGPDDPLDNYLDTSARQ